MRTTINIADDALLAAQHVAHRNRISLGQAVSELVRRGVAAEASTPSPLQAAPPIGRFALLPRRDTLVTVQHVRDLMEREGI